VIAVSSARETEDPIAVVSDALRTLLADGVADRTDAPPDAVALGSPADRPTEAGVRLGVSLYRISRSGRNSDCQRRIERTDQGRTTRKNPPLSLDLRYLLTSYPAPESSDGPAQLLGTAMGVLHDVPVLDPALPERITGETPARVSFESAPPKERAWLWESLPETPYRLSVSYRVGPVEIESQIESAVEYVTERRASLTRSE